MSRDGIETVNGKGAQGDQVKSTATTATTTTTTAAELVTVVGAGPAGLMLGYVRLCSLHASGARNISKYHF